MAQQREPGLDLVRAGAITAVIAYHAGSAALFLHKVRTPGFFAALGGAGVSAFFALSGFLIGRMLLTLIEAPSLRAWWTFMLRRWGRTMPLYAAVLAGVCLVVHPMASSPAAAVDAVLRQLLLLQVVAPSPTGAYVEGLPQAWSLAVEEWFYLAFSVALLGSCRVFGRRALWPVLAAFILLPLAARAAGCFPAAYYSTIGNFDGIACGVALAAIERSRGLSLSSPVALVSGSLLVASAWTLNALGASIYDMPPWTPTVSAIGFCLVLVAALMARDLGRAHRVVSLVSGQSYGLYLVHMPVLDGCRWLVVHGSMSFGSAALLFVASTVALVWAGHRWVELPCMALRPRQAFGRGAEMQAKSTQNATRACAS